MAICPYCGTSAGLFSKYHASCLQQAEQDQVRASQEIKKVVLAAPNRNQPFSMAGDEIRQIASRYKLPSDAVGHATLAGVDELTREEPLTQAQSEYLNQLCRDVLGAPEAIPLSPLVHHCNQVFLNIELSHALWLVMHGQPVRLTTPCDFVLPPGEGRIAEFGTVQLRKSITVSSHAGGYHGISVRIASGLYYRFGGYSGESSPGQVQIIDNGFFTLTNKGLYFAGQQTFRIPYTSILRFKAYPDGLGFFRGFGDGREEIFTVVDPFATLGVRSIDQIPPGTRYDPARVVTLPVGWFLYNSVTFLTTQNLATG
jgi:hypothetical protein